MLNTLNGELPTNFSTHAVDATSKMCGKRLGVGILATIAGAFVVAQLSGCSLIDRVCPRWRMGGWSCPYKTGPLARQFLFF